MPNKRVEDNMAKSKPWDLHRESQELREVLQNLAITIRTVDPDLLKILNLKDRSIELAEEALELIRLCKKLESDIENE
jgi:hypothetical protein